MSLTIKPVETPRDLKAFINFHYNLYKDNPSWVPPLRMDEFNTLSRTKNPAFDFCDAQYWLAVYNGKIVGRIAGIINHSYINIWQKKDARFGWMDFVDDSEVSHLLLSTVEQWAMENDMQSLHGPLGFTDFDAEGLLVEGFDELSTFGAGYNAPYYARHLEDNNYSKDVDYLEYQVTMNGKIPEKVERLANIAASRNKLSMLRVKKAKELLPYAHEIFEVINQSYKALYGFVPLTKRQIDVYVKQYFGFIKPEYVPVVLDRQGKVAAFGITMPSLSYAMQKNQGRLLPFGFLSMLRAMNNNPRADLYLTAVRPDLQNKGVNAMLMYEINKVFIQNNIKYVETNRELEHNTKVQAQWRFYDARQHKRRRVYKKVL